MRRRHRLGRMDFPDTEGHACGQDVVVVVVYLLSI